MKRFLIATLSLMSSFNIFAKDVKNEKYIQDTAFVNNYMTQDVDIVKGYKQKIPNMTTTFDYYSKSLYRIFTKPNFTTSIKFKSNEVITYIAGGNTEFWSIDKSTGGSSNNEFVFVKPLKDNLITNLTVFTNERTYFFEIMSNKKIYNALIEFNYPYENNISLFREKNIAKKQDIKLEQKDITSLNFNYEISNTKLDFSPKQVFDDGLKTVIVFKENIQDMPVVYSYNGKELELVNYRVKNNRMIIDRISNKFQLMLGKSTIDIINTGK